MCSDLRRAGHFQKNREHIQFQVAHIQFQVAQEHSGHTSAGHSGSNTSKNYQILKM